MSVRCQLRPAATGIPAAAGCGGRGGRRSTGAGLGQGRGHRWAGLRGGRGVHGTGARSEGAGSSARGCSEIQPQGLAKRGRPPLPPTQVCCLKRAPPLTQAPGCPPHASGTCFRSLGLLGREPRGSRVGRNGRRRTPVPTPLGLCCLTLLTCV